LKRKVTINKQSKASKVREDYFPDIPKSTFYRWCDTGALPGAYKVGGSWIIDLLELEAGIKTFKEQRHPPAKRGRKTTIGKNHLT